jgi:hypothetical protein
MTGRTYFLLGLLVLVIAGAVYFEWPSSGPGAAAVAPSAVGPYIILSVENPALRLDELDRVRKLEYTGTHRNIFSPTPPPPPVQVPTPEEIKQQQQTAGPQPPAPPAPVVVPATFFGYVTDARTGHKEALFSDSDDVYIAAEGETLLGRFRVLKIGNDSVEVEEISSGRRTTLTMEEPESAPAG